MKRLACLFVWLTACGTTPATQPDANPVETALAAEGVDEVEPEAFEIVSEPVEWSSAGLTLKGTLVRPRAAGPRPAAVIVADWGMRGRDGVIGEVFGLRLPTEVPIYRSIAEGLAARGVAVLIFDKRNCVKDSEPWCSYPAEYAAANPAIGSAFIADVTAAVGWLAAQDGVGSVSLIGHGHGAEVALGAVQRAKIERIVLLQPSTQSLAARGRFQVEESIRQIDARIAAVGDTPEADALKQRKRELEAALGAKDLLGLQAAAAADIDALHAAYLTAIAAKRPATLALLGEADPGEPPGEAERLREVFGDNLVVVPELSRLMVSVASDADPTVVSAAVLMHVSAFLNADLPK